MAGGPSGSPLTLGFDNPLFSLGLQIEHETILALPFPGPVRPLCGNPLEIDKLPLSHSECLSAALLSPSGARSVIDRSTTNRLATPRPGICAQGPRPSTR